MSELARRRRDRDLWISRSHLAAALVGVLLVGVAGFVVGWWAGGPRAAAPPAAVGPADESLVDLLARVDRRVVAQDGTEALTFPQALTGGDAGALALDPAAAAVLETAVDPAPTARHPVDLVVVAPDGEERVRLSIALAGAGWDPIVDGDAIVLLSAPDLESGVVERDRLAAWLYEQGLAPTVELRPSSLTADPPDQPAEGAADDAGAGEPGSDEGGAPSGAPEQPADLDAAGPPDGAGAGDAPL